MSASTPDAEALSRALDDFDPDHETFLVLAEGTLWTYVFSEATAEMRERHEAALAGLGKTHVRIPSKTTQEAYEEMEDFADTVDDKDVQEALFRAIESKGAFRGFREVLLRHPAEHHAWSSFRRERSRQRLEAFLATLGPSEAETDSPEEGVR